MLAVLAGEGSSPLFSVVLLVKLHESEGIVMLELYRAYLQQGEGETIPLYGLKVINILYLLHTECFSKVFV